MNRIIFCIGSNVGNRELYISLAIQNLIQKLELKNTKSSSVLINKALLLENSPKEWDIDFYNIAFSADIDLAKFAPLKILEIVKQIENDLGRQNRGKWAPREIDIDIAAIDDLKFSFRDVLCIPHSELSKRDFFLKTIKEIEEHILEKIQSTKLQNHVKNKK